jgi:aryl-alcohol dehydrogenase-like predicted oxidoreductase
MGTAVNWDYLLNNPVRGVKMPQRTLKRPHRFLTAEEVRRLVAASNELLRTIIILAKMTAQLHIPDPVVSFERSIETLAELHNQGKIRLVGSSNVTLEHIERARKIVPIVSVQNRYSFADREWDYVVNYCERNAIAFIPWFPLGGGKVAGEMLNGIAQARQAGPTQIALAWLLRRSPIMLPIPGTSTSGDLEFAVPCTKRLTDGHIRKESHRGNQHRCSVFQPRSELRGKLRAVFYHGI